MSNWELKIGPERLNRNPLNGRFIKGYTPYNKGKKWSDFMSKRTQKKCLENLKKGRELSFRPQNSGRKKKKVVAVNDKGKFIVFSSIKDAGTLFNCNWANVKRCCKMNQDRTTLKDNKGKMTDRVNTDHRYKGVRFYFENDPIWMEKIKK